MFFVPPVCREEIIVSRVGFAVDILNESGVVYKFGESIRMEGVES